MIVEKQQLLLELVNTKAGSFLLSRLGQTPQYPIVKITNNCFIEKLDENNYRSTHFSKQPLYDMFSPILTQFEITMASKYRDIILDNKQKTLLHFSNLERSNYLPNILLNTVTFNPASGSASPVDGYVGRNGVNEIFSTIRTSAGTTFNNAATSGNDTPQLLSSSTTNQYQQFLRNIYCFDSSSLTSSAVISAATFSIFAPAANSKSNQLGSPDLHVAGATPAATNTLANSDYGQCQTTSFGNVTYAGWTANQYNDFVLNASGISNISQTGISKFSTQLSWDILNNFTGSWASLAQSAFRGNFADDGANLPKLVVTFSLGGSFILNLI